MRIENHTDSHYSESAQEILGYIPSWIIRWGVALIFICLLLVLIGCCVIKFPETVSGTIELTSSDSTSVYGRIIVSSTGIGKVSQGQSFNVKLNGFPYIEFGIVNGVISDASFTTLSNRDGQICYVLSVQFPNGLKTTYGRDLPFIQGMDGTVEIITESRPLITVLIAPLKSMLRNR